ncbi:MAG: FAD-dependent oxidoreductase [Bryobacterales bacterium]|nr:FAD-dependent oxidoreductase [Bryobacteraceae bacterium]MDW8355905.1 FAD-dependent oxidoreductase [Bryobacterales bacterium]
MSRLRDNPVVILGAGPAGLGAAFQLARRGFPVTVVERSAAVGGNAGSFEIEGLRVDYGSHRLHPSCAPEILADIRALLGEDLLERRRHGRIRLRDRWIHFPLQPVDAVLHLPPAFLVGVLRDRFTPRNNSTVGDTFASVLERGLGPTICREFYFPYAEKIWGLPPTEIDAEQARRRVGARSFAKLLAKLRNAIPGLRPPGSGRFFYPRRGYGQISEAYRQAAEQAGARVLLQSPVQRIVINGNRVAGVVCCGAGRGEIPAQHVFSTIPLPLLARLADPPPPSEVQEAAAALRYRAMILIYLVLEADQFTEYDAHYFPEREIPITRLSEPKNYGLAHPPDRTVLCAELPCSTEDAVWSAADSELAALVQDALGAAGLPLRVPIRAAAVRRLEQAYPVYMLGFRRHFDVLDAWASQLEGLVSFGRQGLFAHDNTHHALAMAYAAADCLTAAGEFDRERWAQHRLRFEEHVVED